MKLWILLLPVLLAADPLARLDPHGEIGVKISEEMLKTNKECRVCHTQQKRPAVTADVCFNCHNKAPHSGVIEHLAHNVKCLDCHTSHRAQGKAGDVPGELLKSHSFGTLPEGMTFRSKSQSLIQKSCTDCHSWNKLK